MKKIWNLYFNGDKRKKEIALTFDDGPSKETENILDILKENNAKATFFIWGQRIKGREKIVKRIIEEGHEIGNHTFSHKRLYFKSRKFIEKDITKNDEELKRFGIKTNLLRLPGFKFGLNALIVCKKLNKKVIFCDVMSNDWMKPRTEKVVKKVLEKTRGGSIISFHDYLEGIGSNEEITPIIRKIVP